MRKNHSEIICILDRSGSMASIKDDAIGGFNTFIEGQKKVQGTANVTLVLFDNEYEKVYENIDINSVAILTDQVFVPRNTTALNDAIGKTINEVGDRLNKTPEDQRPEKVLITILTDGYENASREFDNNKIKEMINHQREKYSWEFIYLAANQDAFATAGNYGISKGFASNFVASGSGVRGAFNDMNLYSASYRTSN